MLVNLTASDLINKGKDQANRLGVAAVGDTLTLFINGAKVNQVIDDTYREGLLWSLHQSGQNQGLDRES